MGEETSIPRFSDGSNLTLLAELVHPLAYLRVTLYHTAVHCEMFLFLQLIYLLCSSKRLTEGFV